ncbi:MAG TPA: discoidin domain-containing protein [Myxococcaceae bacterium]|nr:discoidin domain-containing protein [Myxococcaceae bacterium]
MLALAALLLAAAPAPQVLDDFEALQGWSAHPSEGVELRISQDRGFSGKAMRLDFDFHGGAGYAIARKALPAPLKLPARYELSFRIRADAPVNDLEFKLLDASGENVWWMNRRRFDYPREWTRLRTNKRQIEFAWGPKGGGDLDQLAQLELVVTAGTGGKGTVWIDDLTFREREPPPKDPPPPFAPWRSPVAGTDVLIIDLGAERELGGLSIDWDPVDFARAYTVELSSDNEIWEPAYRADGAPGGRALIPLPEAEARFVKLRMTKSARGRGYAIRDVAVKPPEWSLTPNDFFSNVAKEAPRGRYPRYLLREQTYWTVVGASGDTSEALIDAEGMVETGLGGPSLEPFLAAGGRLFTWADTGATPSLARGYLPIPSVVRDAGFLRLTITANAFGSAGRSTVYVTYRVHNRDSVPRQATLYVALRPFQVNPPWQFLNVRGGVARVKEVAVEDREVKVNGERVAFSFNKPAEAWASSYDQGNPVDAIAAGKHPGAKRATDPRGWASAVLAYPVKLPAGKWEDVVVAIPLHPQSSIGREDLAALEDEPSLRWGAELDRFTLKLPPSAPPLEAVIKSQLAYILINRDGPSLQPGSRAYDRSWIRDGLLISDALLRLGHAEEVKAFEEWYAPHQRPDGSVPCCVGPRGADPVPEHDSHGQLISLIANHYRFTGDRELALRMWPHVESAVAFIDKAREPSGLLPASISHEGYSAKPMHSYWDDFFALNGVEDAAWLAAELGKDAGRAQSLASALRRDILASLERVKTPYLPGCEELGDFDATSTAAALSPLDGLSFLPRRRVEATFERYYQESIRARLDGKPWVDFTPYEWRTVGSFLRLGWKSRALEAVDLLLRFRRPSAWNHWAEVVFRDPTTPKFIGDMPHTWVGAEFIRAALDLFAYDRPSTQSLVVGAGIPEAWAHGLELEGVRTRYGALSLKMDVDGATAHVRVGASPGGLRTPPGGIEVRSPIDRPVVSVTVNGAPAAASAPVVLRQLPAEVVFQH